MSSREGFREHLLSRIRTAQTFGLEGLLTIVSSSTDPFQPIEKEQRDTLFALDALLSNGFPVLVMTRNPQMLMEQEYKEVVSNSKLFVDVSIPSLQENNPRSIFYSSVAAPLDETYEAVGQLAGLGKYVRVKIEPIIPTLKEVEGQNEEEIQEIVRRAKVAGVKKIISKTMRLNDSVPRVLYSKLIDYYRMNGVEERNTLALKPELKRQLLKPVYDACQKYKIPFCACVDSDVFQNTVGCGLRVPNSIK